MKKLLTTALLTLACAGTASASNIYINNGVDNGGTADTAAGDTTTGWKSSLKLSYDSNSTVYDNDNSGDISLGDTILSAGGRTGTNLDGDNIVTALVTSESKGAGPSDNGYVADWEMSLRFTNLMGHFDGTGFTYTSGDIDWLLYDSNNSSWSEVHLFTTSVANHTYGNINQVFSGEVSNYGTGTVNGVNVRDIFNVQYGASALSFGDFFAATGNNVRFRIDANTDQPSIAGGIPAANGNPGEFYIGGSHDGSLEFDVPEPASIAILGLGLLGFAASRRKA